MAATAYFRSHATLCNRDAIASFIITQFGEPMPLDELDGLLVQTNYRDGTILSLEGLTHLLEHCKKRHCSDEDANTAPEKETDGLSSANAFSSNVPVDSPFDGVEAGTPCDQDFAEFSEPAPLEHKGLISARTEVSFKKVVPPTAITPRRSLVGSFGGELTKSIFSDMCSRHCSVAASESEVTTEALLNKFSKIKSRHEAIRTSRMTPELKLLLPSEEEIEKAKEQGKKRPQYPPPLHLMLPTGDIPKSDGLCKRAPSAPPTMLKRQELQEQLDLVKLNIDREEVVDSVQRRIDKIAHLQPAQRSHKNAWTSKCVQAMRRKFSHIAPRLLEPRRTFNDPEELFVQRIAAAAVNHNAQQPASRMEAAAVHKTKVQTTQKSAVEQKVRGAAPFDRTSPLVSEPPRRMLHLKILCDYHTTVTTKALVANYLDLVNSVAKLLVPLPAGHYVSDVWYWSDADGSFLPVSEVGTLPRDVTVRALVSKEANHPPSLPIGAATFSVSATTSHESAVQPCNDMPVQ